MNSPPKNQGIVNQNNDPSPKKLWWEKYVGKDLSVFGDEPEFAFLKTITDPPIDYWGDEDIWTDEESKTVEAKQLLPDVVKEKERVFDSDFKPPSFEDEFDDEFSGYPSFETGSGSHSSRIEAIKKEKAKNRRIERMKKSRNPVWVAEQALKKAKRARMAKAIKAAMEATTDEEDRENMRKRARELREQREQRA